MMPFGALTGDDFLGAIKAILPKGPAWRRNPESIQIRFWSGVSDFLAALHTAIMQLFEIDLDPSQTVNLLSGFEEAYGIAPRGSDDQRRARLVSVIADPGGFTADHYVALGAALGITITAARTGAYAWAVHAPAALSSDDRAALEAVINLHNRVTCSVTFTYDL